MIGDGNKYTLLVRTAEHARSRLEYSVDFTARKSKFSTIRVPFDRLVPVRDASPQGSGDGSL